MRRPLKLLTIDFFRFLPNWFRVWNFRADPGIVPCLSVAARDFSKWRLNATAARGVGPPARLADDTSQLRQSGGAVFSRVLEQPIGNKYFAFLYWFVFLEPMDETERQWQEI